MNAKQLDQLTAEEKRVLLARLLQEKTRKSNSYPLSFAQQRLWLLDQLEPNNPAYNIITAYHLVGNLQTARLESCLNQIIQRHASLRTTFTTENESPVQVVHPQLTLSLINHDLRELPTDSQPIEIEKFIVAESSRPFNLSQPPLLRATLLQLSESETIFILVIHHIVADGWSLGIFFKELTKLYQDNTTLLPALTIQYADFTLWQRQHLQGEVLDKSINYWKQQLHAAPPSLPLPTDYPRPPLQTFHGARLFFSFPKILLDNLKKLSQVTGVTLFMTLLAGFYLLLYRYTGQQDIVLGTPIAGRNRTEVEDLIGFFVNTLVLRVQLQGEDDFLQLLAKVKQVALDAYVYQDLPFEILIEQLHPERNLNFSPLFQVMFAFQNVPAQDLKLSGITATGLNIRQVAAKFDLMLFLEETSRGLNGIIEYNTDLFKESTLQRLIAHLGMVLESVATDPQQKISTIPLVTPEEQQLLQQWNATQRSYPSLSVAQLFEQQAEKTPDAIAIRFGTQTLTYHKLNQQANQLAHYLRKHGVQPETLVGIYMERHLSMVVGLLGILKAGGAYLPLDSAYPAQRLAFMLQDSQLRVLVTQNSLLSQLPNLVETVICLDRDRHKIAQESSENPVNTTQLENLAYVIYTSGSTGKPKGVQVLQRGFVNFLHSMQHTFHFETHDKFLAITTISFDIAGLELFFPLIIGAQVVLVNREVATDGMQLIKLLPEVTVMQATPATWRMLLAAGWQGKTALTMLCGGEPLTTELAEQLLTRGSQLWNMYGPTETTVWSTCYQVAAPVAANQGKTEFIGYPIDNTQVYILDRYLQPVPIGVVGELHLTGDGVARGYLQQNELTAEKFIDNPFQTAADAMYTDKLYKTGDLARYHDNGVLECLGRTDNQVKLRGFRIELGEIEATIAQHPQIQEVAVVIHESIGDKRLVAYVILKVPFENSTEILREFLQAKLPEYMVPALIIEMDSLPHTLSGKIDRRSLPEPTQNRQLSSHSFVAPRDEIEAQLVVIFEKLLNTRPISVDDNFFDLGGHSLLGVTLLYKLQQIFHKDIPLMALFRHPTVAQLAELIMAQGYTREWCALEPIQPEGQSKAFFFVGSTNYARVLAPLMKKTHPIYGLNIFGLQNRPEFRKNLSIELIAQHYVKEIEGLQPEGPYYLCAYCADTAIVYEMARELMKRGKQVGFVAFLDSIWEPNDLYFGLYRHWRNIQTFGLSYIGHKVASRLYFIQLAWSLRLNRWIKKLYKKLGKQVSREQQDMSFISHFYEALERYTPTALPGLEITLFLSSEWRWKYSPTLEKLTGVPVKIHEVPVYHDNMFVEPWLLELAAEIDHCLQESDRKYGILPHS
jgi:amino acid adenylation domain-containing protein